MRKIEQKMLDCIQFGHNFKLGNTKVLWHNGELRVYLHDYCIIHKVKNKITLKKGQILGNGEPFILKTLFKFDHRVWKWGLVLMIIFKIWIVGFFLFHLLVYLWARNERKKPDPIFDKIKAVYPIIKIKNNLFYFNGAYITPDLIIYKTQKIKHYSDRNFILDILRIYK